MPKLYMKNVAYSIEYFYEKTKKKYFKIEDIQRSSFYESKFLLLYLAEKVIIFEIYY